jgi:hypothetical protein
MEVLGALTDGLQMHKVFCNMYKRVTHFHEIKGKLQALKEPSSVSRELIN